MKVWRVTNTTEERSLRGHTAAVTAVSFLPPVLATAVLTKFEVGIKPIDCFLEPTL